MRLAGRGVLTASKAVGWLPGQVRACGFLPGSYRGTQDLGGPSGAAFLDPCRGLLRRWRHLRQSARVKGLPDETPVWPAFECCRPAGAARWRDRCRAVFAALGGPARGPSPGPGFRRYGRCGFGRGRSEYRLVYALADLGSVPGGETVRWRGCRLEPGPVSGPASRRGRCSVGSRGRSAPPQRSLSAAGLLDRGRPFPD